MIQAYLDHHNEGPNIIKTRLLTMQLKEWNEDAALLKKVMRKIETFAG